MILDPYLLETLMPDLVGHDRMASAYLVYLQLYRRTHGANSLSVSVALLDIAEWTGLSKRTVQHAVTHLVNRNLLSVTRETLTSVPTYSVHRPWRR